MAGASVRPLLLLAVALAALAGCAPTTMSPMVVRLGPGNPDRNLLQGGVRSGPRITAPLAHRDGQGDVTVSGNSNLFDFDQWSLAYDFAVSVPLADRTRLHIGAQGEIYYPAPLPAYGLYTGVSHYFGTDRYGVAPALVLRGASNFGIDGVGGPGSMFGAELSTSLSYSPEENVSLGLVPFVGIHRVSSGDQSANALYFGGALALSLPLGAQTHLEVTGGFGHVKVRGSPGWTAPIMGLRGGR